MKRQHASQPNIKPIVRWTGRHYLKLSIEEVIERERLRRQIKAEGHLDAHREFLRRVPRRECQ